MIEHPVAIDQNGVVIKPGDRVKIVEDPAVNHHWLKIGNTLDVSHWQDRSIGSKDFICVFLQSKKGGKVCSYGVQDKSLVVVEKK